jgi:uncharacterized protein YhhL (DUF1145 family)
MRGGYYIFSKSYRVFIFGIVMVILNAMDPVYSDWIIFFSVGFGVTLFIHNCERRLLWAKLSLYLGMKKH